VRVPKSLEIFVFVTNNIYNLKCRAVDNKMKPQFIIKRDNPDIKHIIVGSSTLAQMFKLPQHIIDYLWERIEIAKKNPISVKKTLAGNISHSYKLDDPRNLIVHNLFKILYDSNINPHMVQFIDREVKSVYRKIGYKKCVKLEPYLGNMWVNFQKKGEFQPLHTHEGVFSFVIWMEIPYHHEDESNLQFADGESREVSSHIIELSPGMNGVCCFFPSDLSHQVYPFYTSDKDRISISGNIFYQSK
jgi:hypothetical protein